MARKGRPSRGRKKIEIKKIESEEARHVCFSKRRIGVFTKASELSTMCGAQVAVVVYSPSGTPYSFGSPSVDSVVNSFLTQNPARAPPNQSQQYALNKLSKDYMETSEKIDFEKRKKAMLDERAKGVSNSKEFEWLQNVNKLGLDDLTQLHAALKQAQYSLHERINTHMLSNGCPVPMTTNMGLFHGMPSNLSGVGGTTALPAPPLFPPPSGGTAIGPANYGFNPFMQGPF